MKNLMAACENGDKNAVDRILELSPQSVNHQDAKRTPLQVAAEWGHLHVVIALIEKWRAEIDLEAENNHTALTQAIVNDQVEIVEWLLSAGAYVDNCTSDGWSPLMVACGNEDDSTIPGILLEYGAEVDLNVDGHTALMIAIANGNLGVAQTLLDRGANLDCVARSSDGELYTALRRAAEDNYHDGIIWLAEKGADLNLLLGDSTVFMLCVDSHEFEAAGWLLDAGASRDFANADGNTAWANADAASDTEAMEWLLRRGPLFSEEADEDSEGEDDEDPDADEDDESQGEDTSPEDERPSLSDVIHEQAVRIERLEAEVKALRSSLDRVVQRAVQQGLTRFLHSISEVAKGLREDDSDD